MLEYIKGNIIKISERHFILENNGIGYKILSSRTSLSKLSLDEIRIIYLSLIVREDSMSLYGFTGEFELSLFSILTTVTTVGPKFALSILSTLQPGQVLQSIQNNDIDTLCKAPGIGKKTASRICLELTDKLTNLLEDADISVDVESKSIDSNTENLNIAIEALVNLGYDKVQASIAVNEFSKSSFDLNDLIKKSIRAMSK